MMIIVVQQIFDFVVVTLLCYDQLAVGGFCLLSNLSSREERIGCGGYGAEIRSAKKGEDKFRGIGEEYHDDFTLLESQFVETRGNFTGGELDVVVGVDLSGGGIDETWT